MNKNDGGPAFPVIGITYTQPGMSLRDWFAGMALQGMLASNFLKGGFGENTPEIRCNHAYQYADAMIKSRDEGRE